MKIFHMASRRSAERSGGSGARRPVALLLAFAMVLGSVNRPAFAQDAAVTGSQADHWVAAA